MNKFQYGITFALYFIGFFIYSITFSQIIPYMTQIGLNETIRSLLFVSSALLGIFVQLLIGYLSDKYQRVKLYFKATTLILLVAAFLAYTSLNIPEALLLMMIVLTISFFRINSNVIETWTYQIDDSTRQNFGLIRLFGSIGWAVGSLRLSFLIVNNSYTRISYAALIGGLLMILLSFLLPDSQKVEKVEAITVKELKLLLKNSTFVVCLLIYFILFMVHNMDGLTVIDKMVEIQATNQDISHYWSLQAIVELPLMLIGFRLIRRFKLTNMIILVAITYFIRYGIYAYATQASWMVGASALQAITYPLLLITQKEAVNASVPKHLQASGHLIMTSVSSNIVIMILPLLSSGLHQWISYSAILFLGALACFIPIVLSLTLKKESL